MYLTTQNLAALTAKTLLTVTNSTPAHSYAGQINLIVTEPSDMTEVNWLQGTTKLIGFTQAEQEACRLVLNPEKSAQRLADAPVGAYCGVAGIDTLFVEDCADFTQVYRKTGDDAWKLVLSPTHGPLEAFNDLVLQLKRTRHTKPGKVEVCRLLAEIEKLLKA